MSRDFVVIAVVRLPGTGEVQSVIYDFGAGECDVVSTAYAQDTRQYRGVEAPWRKEESFDLIHRAPSGEWGGAGGDSGAGV